MLGLSGRAWNLADGRVEINCEGPKVGTRHFWSELGCLVMRCADDIGEQPTCQAQLSEFEKWCHKGPEGAEEVGLKNSLTKKRRVDKVEVEYVKATGAYSDFRNGGKR